jgi:hypothetical protein
MAAPNCPPNWQQQEHIRRHLLKLYGPAPYAGKFTAFVDYLVAAHQGGYIEICPETRHREFRIGRIAMTEKIRRVREGQFSTSTIAISPMADKNGLATV